MGKILVLGRRGQLAREMARLPLNSGVELEFSGRERCDIRDTEGLRRLIDELEPIAVVNTAAYTDVDLAESEEDIVFAVNATAPGAAARECAIRGVPFVHLSSDFVFSGSRDGAYQDDAPTDPINTYGRAKARGEALVQEAAGELGCVLRAAWLHGRYGRNFAATMYRLIGREERIGVVTDQIGNPTRAADAARVSLEVAQALRGNPAMSGVINYVNAGIGSRFDFANEVRDRMADMGLKTARVEPVTSDAFPTLAKRPSRVELNTDKAASLGLQVEDWRTGVARSVQELHLDPED
jgi:dTDP-4-dehydrorhamnose reductase